MTRAAPRRSGASEVRVTLQFRSDSGGEYLYDDVTGAIFPWSESHERALQIEMSNASRRHGSGRSPSGPADVDAPRRLVRKWRTTYGAFSRSASDGTPSGQFTAADIERHIRDNAFELLLILTENCNLRCRYCALSDVYPLNRVRTTRAMSLETARRAVDWYAALVQPQRQRNPRKRFGLSLYGGEPLLNRRVLEGILTYCRTYHPRTFIPVLTTNGTLLTRSNVELLVEHGVMVAVSIDGPPPEHDRLRVDSKGRGTFARIAANLQAIRNDFPDYWASKVTSVSVYDCGTDLEAVADFFAAQGDALPRSVFVNQVGAHNTEWYSRYGCHEVNRLTRTVATLRTRYKRAKVAGEAAGHYVECLVGLPIAVVGLRRRALDAPSPLMPFSGACVPGTKVAVHVDGTIDMCERVNGTYPLGHLDRGGMDYERVREILERYHRDVLGSCARCPVTKQCQLCFSHVEGRASFARDPELCANIRAEAARRMADYLSILEQNPNADFRFETDTARVEERMLFLC